LKTIIKIFVVLFINFSFAQVGIGTVTPGNSLEINSTIVGSSGLRFTQLNSSSTKTNDPGNLLAVNATGDVIMTTSQSPKVFSTVSAIDGSTTITNSTLVVGEIELRYNSNTTTPGNLEFRSSNASTLDASISRHEEYNSNASGYASGQYTLHNNAGTYTAISAGGCDNNELLLYTIVTANGGFYRITVANRNNFSIFIIAEKIL
jgi:hypothetical protein